MGGEGEAALSFGAVARSVPALAAGELCVLDVGGGSTELISAAGGAVRWLRSVPVGAVRLTERCLHGDPPAPAEAQALAAAAEAALAPLDLLAAGRPALVGTAGTVTTLAAVALGLPSYDAARVHGLRLARAEVARQLALYLALPLAGRRRIPGLPSARADVIAAGATIVCQVMDRLRTAELTVCDRGIRWGLAYELYSGRS